MSAADQLSASLANTGSLPDLTSVHYPGTLKTAIYKEPETSSSPYSSVITIKQPIISACVSIEMNEI